MSERPKRLDPEMTLSHPPPEYPEILALEKVVGSNRRDVADVDTTVRPKAVVPQPAEVAKAEVDLGSHIEAPTAEDLADAILKSCADLDAIRARTRLEITMRDRAWFKKCRASATQAAMCDRAMKQIEACIDNGDFDGAKRLVKGR